MTGVVAVGEAAARRRVRWRIAAATAAIVVVAAVAGWFVLRGGDPSPGPLKNPETASIWVYQHPGDDFGYGLGMAWNVAHEPAVLKRIRLVEPTPGLRVISTAVGGSERKLLTLDATHEWPTEEFTDQHPVAGFEVAPFSEPAGKRGVEFLFGLHVDRLGSYQARAIAVDYTVGGKEHTAYIRQGIKVCVVPDSHPLKGRCGFPTGMTDPID